MILTIWERLRERFRFPVFRSFVGRCRSRVPAVSASSSYTERVITEFRMLSIEAIDHIVFNVRDVEASAS